MFNAVSRKEKIELLSAIAAGRISIMELREKNEGSFIWGEHPTKEGYVFEEVRKITVKRNELDNWIENHALKKSVHIIWADIS